MILYSFTNMYTPGIHAGIQTAHMLDDMWSSLNGLRELESTKVLEEWSRDHKTIVVLNGGSHKMLEETLWEIVRLAFDLDLPYSYFHESKEALNGALTCVGIIVPKKIYKLTKVGCGYASENEVKLYNLIKRFPLAI